MRSLLIGSGLLVLFSSLTIAQIGIPSGDSPIESFAIDPHTYGVTSETSHTINAFEFQPRTPADTIGFITGYRRFISSTGDCCLNAPFMLPAGAMITAHELVGCDTTTTGRVRGIIGYVNNAGVVSSIIPFAYTGASNAATPGCGVFRFSTTAPHTVNNAAQSYIYEIANEGTDRTGLASFSAVRIYYKLQVRPAPATATFPNDVPTTHPFFRFIEALAASGVTSGCAPGSFCPNAPITRGEMAVFLSAALGLHWAP